MPCRNMDSNRIHAYYQHLTTGGGADGAAEIGALLSGIDVAFTESVRNQSYTPLLKQELKARIQIKRLQMGLEELKVDFEPRTKYELREEEVQKQERRREVNRKAAVKFRKKKKSHILELEKRTNALQEANTNLQEEIKLLKRLQSFQMESTGNQVTVINND